MPVKTCNPNNIEEWGFSNVPAKAIKYSPVTSCITVTVALRPQTTKEVRGGYPQLMGAHFVMTMGNNDVQSMLEQFTSHWRGTVAGVYMIGDIAVWSDESNIWKNYKEIFKKIVAGRAGVETRYWILYKSGQKGARGAIIEMEVRGDNIRVIIDGFEWTSDANGKDGPTCRSVEEAINSADSSF
jgi:hypothetical protein